MRALIVLTVCVSACLAHGNYGGDSGFRSGGRSQGNLIDYPFTVQESRSSSDTGNYRTINFPQPQQQQQQQQQFQQRRTNNARSQTQYIDIPYIVESSSRQQQPQISTRSFQQQQPQIRQQQQTRQQPSFQIERSQPVASFDWPSSQSQRQIQPQRQQQQQRSFTSGNSGGYARSQSRLIDYPFTVEVRRSSGSSGGLGNSNSNFGSQW